MIIENVIEDRIDPRDGENSHRFLLLGAFGGGGRSLGRRRLRAGGRVYCKDARTISARSVLHVWGDALTADEPTDVGVANTRRRRTFDRIYKNIKYKKQEKFD